MKLRWRVLKKRNAPFALASGCNQRLNRIESRFQVALSWRNHANDGAKHSHLRIDKAHVSDLAHIGRGEMIMKNLLQRGRNFHQSDQLAPIEANAFSILQKERGKRMGVSPV